MEKLIQRFKERMFMEVTNVGTDIHTHMFNREMISRGFIGDHFPWSKRFFDFVGHAAHFLNPFTKKDRMSIYANFVQTLNSSPEEIYAKYNSLMEKVLPDWKITPYHLAIDFKSDGGVSGDLGIEYAGQKLKMREMSVKYFNFINILGANSVKDCLGIKFYGSLICLEPEKFIPTWLECEKYGIPVITHCATGSLHNSSFKKDHATTFNNPKLWEPVLRKCPQLKLCFAHAGGSDEVINDGDYWKQIKLFMAKYKNVCFDLSFSILNEKIVAPVKEYLLKNNMEDRLMFGSDYSMITSEKYDPITVTVNNYTAILPMSKLQHNNTWLLQRNV